MAPGWIQRQDVVRESRDLVLWYYNRGLKATFLECLPFVSWQWCYDSANDRSNVSLLKVDTTLPISDVILVR
jgi:hypothetical protein